MAVGCVLVAFASNPSHAEVVKCWQVVPVSGKHLVDHLLDLCQRQHSRRQGIVADGPKHHGWVAG